MPQPKENNMNSQRDKELEANYPLPAYFWQVSSSKVILTYKELHELIDRAIKEHDECKTPYYAEKICVKGEIRDMKCTCNDCITPPKDAEEKCKHTGEYGTACSVCGTDLYGGEPYSP